MGDVMTLTKLPKHYYRLNEVAEEWEYNITELLYYAEQELLTICAKPNIQGNQIRGYKIEEDETGELQSIPKLTYDGCGHEYPHDLFPINNFSIRRLLNNPNYPATSTSTTFPFLSTVPKGDPMLEKINYWRGDFSMRQLFITHEEKERFKLAARTKELPHSSHNIPDLIEEATTSQTNTTVKTKGGRPKSTFTKVIEHAFNHLYQTGNTEILKAGKIKEFMSRLKDFANERKENNINYISDLIKEVKIRNGKYIVTTEDDISKTTKHIEITHKGAIYTQNDVSKIMTRLRSEYPL